MEWLLDTSVFYWASSVDSQNRVLARGARLTTSCSTLLEIMSGMTPANFDQRKRALRSVVRLCGREGILLPDTDATIAIAFGRTIDAFDLDAFWPGVRATVDAPSLLDLERGLLQPVSQTVLRLGLQALAGWDRATGESFKKEMDGQYGKLDPNLRLVAQRLGMTGKEVALFVRDAQAATAHTTDASKYALVGLAARAGIVDEARLRAVKAERDLADLCDEVQEAYDGTLDGFLRVYTEYHAECATNGRGSVGQNDALDLDPFVYFRASDETQHYASAEKLWLRIVNRATPGRSIDIAEVTRRASEEPALPP